MAKKKKNSNYVTEKTSAAKAERELADKKKKKAKLIKSIAMPTLITVLIIGAVLGIGAAFGMFEHIPEPTDHMSIALSDGTELHIELYGNDAPQTVSHIKTLVNSKYFDEDIDILSFINGAILMGENTPNITYKGVLGEFRENGVKNKVKHERGVISMSRGEDYDSGYGNFFILTEDREDLDGSFAAFGKVTSGLEDLERIALEYSNPDGTVSGAPFIKNVSIHGVH